METSRGTIDDMDELASNPHQQEQHKEQHKEPQEPRGQEMHHQPKEQRNMSTPRERSRSVKQ